MKKSLVIGIGGVSRAGKTTLATLLSQHLNDKYDSVVTICLDDFVVEEEQLPKIRDRYDWEHPQSVDWFKLVSYFEKARKKFDVVIVEGIFTFLREEIFEHFDISLFLTIRKETFMRRRKEDNRWGPEPDWYLKHVWQSYLAYGLPSIPVHELEGSHMWVMDTLIERIGLDRP